MQKTLMYQYSERLPQQNPLQGANTSNMLNQKELRKSFVNNNGNSTIPNKRVLALPLKNLKVKTATQPMDPAHYQSFGPLFPYSVGGTNGSSNLLLDGFSKPGSSKLSLLTPNGKKLSNIFGGDQRGISSYGSRKKLAKGVNVTSTGLNSADRSSPSRKKFSEPSPEKKGHSEPYLLGASGSKSVLHVKGVPPCLATRRSTGRVGVIAGYAANTHQGTVRTYNEDRISIVTNIQKHQNNSFVGQNHGSKGQDSPAQGPICSYFGIFDGHGGHNCADFLRDRLHEYIIQDPSFPSNPKEALRNGFVMAEKRFTEMAQEEAGKNGEDYDQSGSCALVILIVDDVCYVANLGDSRAVMSVDGGEVAKALTKDHRPTDEEERRRILAAGGKIYQNMVPVLSENFEDNTMAGPVRVLPGRLSVSRTFGDIEAKLTKLGGNPRVVIAEPDIKSFKIKEEFDYIFLGTDGVFDMIKNEEVTSLVWSKRRRGNPDTNFHDHVAQGLEAIMKETLERKALDNISLLLIAFDNFERHFVEMSPPESASAKARLKQLNTVTESELAAQLNLPASTTASGGGRGGRKYVHLTKQLSHQEDIETIASNLPPQRKQTAKPTNNQPASYRLPSRDKTSKEPGLLSESHRSTGKVTVGTMISQRK